MEKWRGCPLVQTVWCAVFCLISSGISWSAETDSDTAVLPCPPLTFNATRGLTQTASAEALGEGRLSFNLIGSWYSQENSFQKVPLANSDITTGLLSFSFGVNSYIDIFGSIAGFGIMVPAPGENDFGLGSVSGGIQGALPLPRVSPLHLGAQIAIIGGTASDQIDSNNADGYDYFETRTGYDFMGKIMETLVFGNENMGIKFHLNQGAVMSLQNNRDMLLLLGGGVQGSVHPMVVLGLELNSRTYLKTIAVRSDPLWLTPSVQFRSPYYFNVVFGTDISLSKERQVGGERALEPYRIFGGFSFSFDLLANKRQAMSEKEKKEAAEKSLLQNKVSSAQALADSLARKAHADSVAMEKARETEQLKADSLAEKARQDSITLVETRRKLDEEKSKRSDAEKQLLSTGLLLLDAVYFESGRSDISINSYPYLNIIGKMLTKYPKLQIEVSGHTDNVGKFQSNMILSQTRADAVRIYLIQVAPELSNMLTARGYGSTQPKASNTTADGRKLNRRTELHVLNKDVLKEYNQ
jgi:outer membrane protein OmpA-like peptidoglycan-associated protein